MSMFRLFCVCLSLLTVLAYVCVLLAFHPLLQVKGFLMLLREAFQQASAAVLVAYSAWTLSTIYMDIYLWFRRTLVKDKAAAELVIYSGTEGGGEDAPITKKQKWLVAYPFYVTMFLLAWYYVVYPAPSPDHSMVTEQPRSTWRQVFGQFTTQRGPISWNDREAPSALHWNRPVAGDVSLIRFKNSKTLSTYFTPPAASTAFSKSA